MNKVLEFLNKNSPFYLASLHDKEPNVRPMGLAFEYQGRIYFGCGTKKQVYRQIVENPSVQLATTAPDGTWLRYTGKATVDVDPHIFDAAVNAFPPVEKMYPRDSENTIGFFFLKNGVALFCDVAGTIHETINL
ncbi:MAG: pyridoxamine 5'-phosphate oxidase family protein [Deltaproteobacteria bacterium]|jgi:uncharacterized pyridoxamine 5'-phosphate oxidase family protein|nr:pyridoxamine 5'-phosphate oxidase family protein [Deltaproteobacteria bacterium]